MAATGTYRRQARLMPEDLKTIKNALKGFKAKHGDAVYQAKLKEEIEFWEEDLRSFSTEWEDEDEEQSGLGDLADAGWHIRGLDLGQPVTPRQLELAEIAARLAGQVARTGA
jgi:hypothetical protein